MSVGESSKGGHAPEGGLTLYTITIPEEDTNYFFRKTGIREYEIFFSAGEERKLIRGIGRNKKGAVSHITNYKNSELPWHMGGDINTGEAVVVGHEVSLKFKRGYENARYMGPGVYLAEMIEPRKKSMPEKERKRFSDECRAYSYPEAESFLIKKHGARYVFKRDRVEHDVLIQRAAPIHTVRLGPVVPGNFPIRGRNEEDAVRNLVGWSFDDFINFFGYRGLIIGDEEEPDAGRESYIKETVGCILECWDNEEGPVQIFPGEQLKMFKHDI